MEGLWEFFSSKQFMPHGHCYLWKPGIVWTMVITDSLIGFAYLSISASLYALVRKIKVPFSAMFIAFGLFIFACGATHFMEIYNLWVPNYWLSAVVKSITALASVATAFLMFPVKPKIAALAASAKTSEQRRVALELVKGELESKVEERTRQLSAAVEARDEFLSIASHELKTPLTPLKIQLQMMQKALKSESPNSVNLEQAMDTSLRQIDRLTALVESLLDVTRIKSGNFIGNVTSVDLAEIIGDVVQRFAEPIRLAAIEVRQDLAPGVVGEWDRLRVEQVITNLISNAIKYGAGRPIQIVSRKIGDRAEIEVIDQGIGIAAEKVPLIFDRFERAVPHFNISGLGLGLFIVKQIVEAHNGEILVTSQLGEGSRFTVKLPLNKNR